GDRGKSGGSKTLRCSLRLTTCRQRGGPDPKTYSEMRYLYREDSLSIRDQQRSRSLENSKKPVPCKRGHPTGEEACSFQEHDICWRRTYRHSMFFASYAVGCLSLWRV